MCAWCSPGPRYEGCPPCGWVACGAPAVACLAGALPELPRGFRPMLGVEGRAHRWTGINRYFL